MVSELKSVYRKYAVGNNILSLVLSLMGCFACHPS